MPSSKMWCALIPLFLLGPSSAFPQGKQGTVKVDSLAVYSGMSTDSDVVQELPQGTVVRVLITVTGEEGNWCGIANQGGSSRIGYVLCSGLDRPKDTAVEAVRGGSLSQIEIISSYTPVKAPKRKANEIEDGGIVGLNLAPLAGYNWSSHPKTLVIAIRKGCPYCDASLPFYRRLGEQERGNTLHAHVLLVMPNDASSGSRYLSKENVEVQRIFGQGLGALKISGTPTVLLLDSSGLIKRTWIGQLSPRGEQDVMKAAAE